MPLSDQMQAEIDKQKRMCALQSAVATRDSADNADQVLVAAEKYYEFLSK